MIQLPILHFNDVYRVNPQKISPTSPETINVTQFAALLDDLRSQAEFRGQGLTLFSGDLFSPSVESTITRGSHMARVPVINELAPDVSLTGNHDFDFGYPHLSKLIKDTTFPWLLSNIIDTTTLRVPEGLHEFQVFEKAGLRIGVIGLVEKEWISTVSSWPPEFKYRDMKEVGIGLSKRLRDRNGEHKCDLVIALTHSRVPNDIKLAKDILALSPSAQKDSSVPFASTHGVDILLGGHDHLYYVSRGVDIWEGYDITQPCLGGEEDHGDVLVIKSGTDFRDFSHFVLELEKEGQESVRRYTIRKVSGKRYTTQPGSKSSQRLAELLKKLLGSVSETLKAPIARTLVAIDVRSQLIRTEESVAANWFADILRHAYDDALCLKGCDGSDGVFICAGTLRGDSVYGPGNISLGDIIEILPFEDPIVVIELDGEAIWDALEASLSTWPAQEGRFPVISGFRVSWDSRKKPGERVLGVWLIEEGEQPGEDESKLPSDAAVHVIGEGIKREKGGRKYQIVTREYMAQGHDGFLALKDKPYLVDDEGGQLMSSIVRKYLLGSHYINKMKGLVLADANPATRAVKLPLLSGPEKKQASALWHHAVDAILHPRAKGHYRDRIGITATEDMSGVDVFDGSYVRREGQAVETADEGVFRGAHFSLEDLPVVKPAVDGRLVDEGRK